MRVYFDICALQRPFDDQSQLRVRIEAEAVLSVLALCEIGALELVSSGAHDVENAKYPLSDRRAHVEDVLALAAFHTQASALVLQLAESFTASGIKKLDAIHLASAVESGADYFCTTDDSLLKKGREVNTGLTMVVSPIDLISHLGSR